MRLVQVLKRVWLESVSEDAEWRGIEKDLPADDDAMLVFVYDPKTQLPSGIFHLTHHELFSKLDEISVAASELDPAMFRVFKERKIKTPILVVETRPDTRIGNLEPSVLRFVDPAYTGPAPGEISVITLTSMDDYDLRVHFDSTQSESLAEIVDVCIPEGFSAQSVIDYIDRHTTYLLERKSYRFKGE